MDFLGFSPDHLLSFFLTLIRISIVLFLLPFFGSKTIPNQIKAALSIALTLALWPKLSFPAELFPRSGWAIAVMLLGEGFLGLTLGMLVRLLFSAVQTGGHIVGFQMGFAMVNVVDPVTGVSEAVTAHFLYMCTMLVFMTLNGHLYLLKAMAMTFQYVPPGQMLISPIVANEIFKFSAILFTLAIKIAAPVMAAIFLIDLALALISKTAPQMHVLVIGFPIKISIGFFFLSFLFNAMAIYVTDFIKGMDALFLNILKAIGAS